MIIRRKTLDRLLTDQQRAHQRDRAELIATIRDLNDRLMLLAGRQYAPTPLDIALVEPAPAIDADERFPDPTQLPDNEILVGW